MDVAGAQARALPLLLGRTAAFLRCSVSFSCGGARRSWASSATADWEDGGQDYERVAMDTPGAYWLVDWSTRKSVIVWGGVDDGEEPGVPSSTVLSRVTADRSAPKENGTIFYTTGAANGGNNAGVGSFGRLKAQKVQALARRSAVRTSIARRSESSYADSDEDGSKSGRRKFVPDPARRAKQNDDSRDERSRAVRSLNSVLRQYKGDDDSDLSDEEAAFGPKVWGKVADATSYRREDRKQKVPLDSGFFSRRSFKEIGCGDEILGALRTFGFPQPSHIQAMAYGPVLEGRSCIIADQSGSGKTLAYLCPIVQNLRKEEAIGIHKPSPRNPRVIILTPTAELSSQVLQNCRSISKSGVPFRSMVATGGFRQKTNWKALIKMDILFSEEGFEQVLHQLITVAPVTTQYLFVTATLPLDIYNKVVETFPDCEVIMGPSVHRTSARLEEVVEMNNDEKNPETAFSNKRTALLKIIEESPVRKTIIFCNKIETCRKVENVLTRLDRKASQIKVLPFHAALDQAKRIANMKEFLKKQTTDSMFLVCTDRASRGIDFTNVNHVVLFDYPRDPSEYVRRVGRTARGASGDGKAFVFAVGKQVSLARRVMERNLKGHPLHDVPCFQF
ncbi:hypothetical protein VPH35_075758 [Triticum aestivum]